MVAVALHIAILSSCCCVSGRVCVQMKKKDDDECQGKISAFTFWVLRTIRPKPNQTKSHIQKTKRKMNAIHSETATANCNRRVEVAKEKSKETRNHREKQILQICTL